MIKKRSSHPKRGYYSYSYEYKKPKPKPKRRINIVLTLIALNFIIFLAVSLLGFFSSSNCEDTICKYVALQPSSILSGENLWTVITSMFIHGSFFHLFVNMLSLFFLGSFLEKLVGSKRFLFIYIISGILASLFFVFFAFAFGQNLTIPAVGASGAIFGIGGVLAVLTPKVPVYLMFIPIPMPLWFGIALMLVLIWLVSAVAGLPIGNTAHLGGLIAGLIYGFFLRLKHKKKVAMLNRFISRQSHQARRGL